MNSIQQMNLTGRDLNLLMALDALLTERSVSRAAEKIGLSQPATSHALGRLRQIFNDPLLVRVGTRMDLTPRAEALRAPLAEEVARSIGSRTTLEMERVFRQAVNDEAT
jgi:DNA-binding transcriptional LysR family regulator